MSRPGDARARILAAIHWGPRRLSALAIEGVCYRGRRSPALLALLEEGLVVVERDDGGGGPWTVRLAEAGETGGLPAEWVREHEDREAEEQRRLCACGERQVVWRSGLCDACERRARATGRGAYVVEVLGTSLRRGVLARTSGEAVAEVCAAWAGALGAEATVIVRAASGET